jgi:urea transport system permease protein
MGGLFIAVVMYFPNGLAGLWQTQGKRLMARLRGEPKPAAVAPTVAPAAAPAVTTVATARPSPSEPKRDGIEPGATLEASK